MNRILPSRKIVPILVACLIAVGTVVFAAGFQKIFGAKDPSASRSQKIDLSFVDSTLEGYAALDDDGDSLKNWEETLWKTDVKNPDTDGDGTQDGEEVRQNRNPLVKGPDDKLEVGARSSLALSGSGENLPDENLTETDKFSREFFYEYLRARSEPSFDEAAFVKNFAESNSFEGQSRRYTSKDLAIITAEDDVTTQLKNYGNAAGLALVGRPMTGIPNEMETLENAIEKKSAAELEKLNPIIASYENTIKDLLAVPVPKEAVSVHLELLNNLSAVLGNIKDFKKALSDTFVVLIAVTKHKNDATALGQTLQKTALLFDENGVSFENGEYGNMFAYIK